jgi:cysteine desulfurase
MRRVFPPVERCYFDHNATTPVSSEVLEAHTAALSGVFGNASSIHHFGQEAKLHLDSARRDVGAFLGCDAREVVFVSGGTESDNLALLGFAGGHVITTAIEHPAVLNACARFARATYIKPGPDGVVDPEEIRSALAPDTLLISVMHANNETGVIQPIAEIARIAHEAGVLFHSDGVQAAGKIPLNVGALGADLYSISGHKFYGIKGTGALFVRTGVILRPLMFGGHHERDRRPGTENVPGAVALGRAAALAADRLESDGERLAGLRDRLEQRILSQVADAGMNGMRVPRVPNTTNLYFDGIEAEALVIALDLKGFAVSTGSACSSGAVEPSHVLIAMGLSPERARASVRFSLGRSNTAEQVDALADAVVESVVRLRKLSPAYAGAAQ